MEEIAKNVRKILIIEIQTLTFSNSSLRTLFFDLSGLDFTESVAFRGEGYLELSNQLLPHLNPEEEEEIQLEISTKRKHGLLFYHGQPPTDLEPDDYMSVGLVDGHVEFSFDLGDGTTTIVSKVTVDDGEKHKVIPDS